MLSGQWVSINDAAILLDRTYKRDQDGQFSSGGGGGHLDPEVEALPRMAALPTATQAAQGTNPSYGATSVDGQPIYRDAGRAGERWTPEMGPPPYGAYEENCTNAVMAFEMRMRGFDVQAAPLDVLDKHGYAAGRTFQEMEDHISSSWSLPDGSPHGRGFRDQKWRSFDEVDAEVKAWPEGGRGFMTVGKHVFSVVKSGGKAKYMEAQHDASPTRDVTREYKKKYKAGLVGSDGSKEEAKVVRLDDLVPTRGILDSVVAA